MNWITELLHGESVAHAMLVLSLVAVLGLALGQVRVAGIGLGIAGVLFAGLAFGHFGLTINHEVLEFCREFGLILFVYAIGLQVGPGFFSSLRKQGLALNLMAAAVVLLGVATTLFVSWAGKIPIPVAVGLFSGATTNTPSLAAAQQALKDAASAGGTDASALPGLGYAVAYPFGVLGIILSMVLLRFVFRIKVAEEVARFQAAQGSAAPLETLHVEVRNQNLNGVPVRKLPHLKDSGVVVSRVKRGDSVQVAQADTRIETGDVLLAVGEKESLDEFRVLVGERSDVDLREAPGEVTTRRMIVTRHEILGKTVHELNWAARFGVVVTRIIRAGVEFSPRSNLGLQFGDSVLAVGPEAALAQAATEAGNSPKELDHPSIIALFAGVAVGVFAGSWPLMLPGVPAPVKLGLAGGPLLAAIILSRIGRIGPLLWYLPPGANLALRELGIVLFLACVGLKAGDRFVPTLLEGSGFAWMGWAALITLLPLLVVALFARLVLKQNYASLCGLMAGSMTDPPALAFAGTMTASDAPSISYATVYPLVMLLRVVAAQAIVIFFLH